MKKLVSLLLVCVLVFSLNACGNKEKVVVEVNKKGNSDIGENTDAFDSVFDNKKARVEDIVIAAGYSHIAGLKSDGTVVAVEIADPELVNGNFDYDFYDEGQCNVSEWTDIVAVSAGDGYTVGLKSDGTVVATEYIGDHYNGQCDVSDWTDIVAISAGDSHTVGLKSDGTVVAVGYNFYGQCDVLDWTDIVAISAGDFYTVGLKSDGTVVSTKIINDVDDFIDDGQCDVSDWTDIVAISAGDSHTVGLKSDGTVVTAGGNWSSQCDVSDWEDIVVISAGWRHTIGLKSNGTVVVAGCNYYGEGNVSEWEDIVAISAGDFHTVGLKSDGTVVVTKLGYDEFMSGFSDGLEDCGHCDVSGWTNMMLPRKK